MKQENLELKHRIIESKEEYKIKWIDKCQEILEELNVDFALG